MKILKCLIVMGLITSSSLCYPYSITKDRQEQINKFLENILIDEGTPVLANNVNAQGSLTTKIYKNRLMIEINPYSGNAVFDFSSLTSEVRTAISEEAKRGRRLIEVYNSEDVVNADHRFFQAYDPDQPAKGFVGSPLMFVTLSNDEQSQVEEILFNTLPDFKKDLWYANETDIGKAFENYIFMKSARSQLLLYTRWNKTIDDSKLVLEAMDMAAVDLNTPGTEAYDRAISAFIRPEVAYLIKAVGASYDKSVFDSYMFEAAALIKEAATRDLPASEELMKVDALKVKLEEFSKFNNSRKVIGK
jgi:hypothetical protein